MPCVKDHMAVCGMRRSTSVLHVAANIFATILLGDRYFPLTASNFGNLAAFRAIFMAVLCNGGGHYIFAL